MLYKITDNFLPREKFIEIKNLFLSPNLPWYYNNEIIGEGHEEDEFQFTHIFYNNWAPESMFLKDISSLTEKIKPKAWIRIKANLGVKSQENKETGYHTDFDFECTTAIFYLNTNNGYTLFEDGTKIESVQNRLVEFNSLLKHTGVTQTDEKVRCLINLNYF